MMMNQFLVLPHGDPATALMKADNAGMLPQGRMTTIHGGKFMALSDAVTLDLNDEGNKNAIHAYPLSAPGEQRVLKMQFPDLIDEVEDYSERMKRIRGLAEKEVGPGVEIVSVALISYGVYHKHEMKRTQDDAFYVMVKGRRVGGADSYDAAVALAQRHVDGFDKGAKHKGVEFPPVSIVKEVSSTVEVISRRYKVVLRDESPKGTIIVWN